MRASLALASGALALALAVGFAAPAPAAAADDELIRVIAPRDEGLASGGSVLIRVRLDPGAKLRSAKLNGAGIRRLLRPVGDGRELRVRLTRRDARRLNHGRNFLRLVAARKKSRDYRAVVFTLVREARGLVSTFRARYERRRGLRVRLVTSKLRTKVRASLNGRDVSRGFASELRAPRTVDLGAGDGLRHGRNVLKLTVTHFDGQIRRLRRVVNVPRGVTIAGTGRLRQLQQGGSARLDATSSRPALRLGGRPARGGLEYRWKIVARPRGSSPALSGARGSRPLLRADLPGRYRVRLATTMKAAPEGDSATTSYAEAEVEVEPQPFARVDTMASAAGSAGIAVEVSRECEAGALAAKPPCFYPATNPQSTLQVVIVDRQDLTEVSNTSYSLADLGKFAADMEGLISNLGNKTQAPEYESEKLVLISSRAATVADAANLAAGLAVFNVDSAGQPAALEGLASAGPFSIIAAPGTLEGKTAINFGTTEIVAPDGTKLAPGAVVGAIKETQEEGDGGSGPLRSFAWPDALGYDTRAEGGKAFKIGTQAVTIVPEGKAADLDGIAVFTFNPVNPVGSVTRAAFVGNSGAEGSEAGLEWSLLASSLKSAYEKKLGIALVSNGDIGRFGSEPQAASFLAVQRWLEELQVNPDILARAVAANGTYSMVSAGVRPGAPKVAAQFRAGYSASSVLAEGVAEGSKLNVGEGRLTGVMQRTTYGAFFPNAGNPGGTPPEPGMLQVIYDKQVPWLLTPAPGASTASCQQLAFAYLTESIPGLFPNGPPDLWTGADASACEGIPHAAGGGVRSPDTLTGDECASTEAAAIGANPAAVREASMALRTLYSSLDSEISETKISEATRPADAPFTEADLNCARKQMIDEISARGSVLKFMEVLEAPQEHTQQQTDTELGEIAEEVEVATLASIKAKIEDPEKSTGSFWAGFALQALGSATGIVAFNAADGGAVEKGARILEMIAGGGSTTLTLAQGPGGNPVALTDQYILLAAQLKEEQVKIEKQISDVLAAQQAGTEAAAAIMLADPGKLATVQTNVDGSWQIDAKALQAAQDAFLYRVRQLTYEAYWPQAYSAVRFSSKGLCHGSTDGGCWNGSEWSESDPVPFEHASQAACSYGEEEIDGFTRPFGGADPGTPSGLGIGNEYQPLSVPVAAGTRPTATLDYVMVETQTLGEKVPRLADDGIVSVFFGQPQDGFEDPVKGEPGGFYAPEFWWRTLAMDKRVECNDESGRLKVSETGGAFQDVEESTDLWPVEPSSYCAKKPLGNSVRATCTYDSDYYRQRTLNVGRLVEGLGGEPGKSPVWLQAFGGAGGFGGEEINAGYGGAGGLARSYYESAASMAKSLGSPTLHFFLGEQGKEGSGAGGASTVVASEDITNGAEKPRPCIFEDPAAIDGEGKAIAVATWPKGSCSAATQNVFLVAGGGGGGGHEAGAEVSGSRGRNGGRGGIAKATTKTASAAGAAGESHKDSHRGYGGANGEGGKAGEGGHPESGEAGIGGQGGAAGSGGHALWFNAPSFFGGETRGTGGADGSGNGGHGGGGGGGFGGGAGGGAGGHSSSDDYGGSGGGGGGSYAFKGDAPPSENQPSAVAPGKNGSLVIVVDGLSSAGSIDVVRGCRFPRAGSRGATRAEVAYRNLGAGNRRVATCANARALVGESAKRPGKQRFRSRGFTCRSQQPRPRAGQSKRTTEKRWTCVYRGKSGQSRVRFLTHR